MKEKIVGKKIGLPVMVITILVMTLSVVAIGIGGEAMESGDSAILFIVGIVAFTASCFVLPGLKVLKPQEALVLTLFGKYVGTLKGDGFYFVNPFCTSFNPASKTKLKQSGDVNHSPISEL